MAVKVVGARVSLVMVDVRTYKGNIDEVFRKVERRRRFLERKYGRSWDTWRSEPIIERVVS